MDINNLAEIIKGEELWTLQQTIEYWMWSWKLWQVGLLDISFREMQEVGEWFLRIANTKI